jgi:hypothetical protein
MTPAHSILIPGVLKLHALRRHHPANEIIGHFLGFMPCECVCLKHEISQ